MADVFLYGESDDFKRAEAVAEVLRNRGLTVEEKSIFDSNGKEDVPVAVFIKSDRQYPFFTIEQRLRAYFADKGNLIVINLDERYCVRKNEFGLKDFFDHQIVFSASSEFDHCVAAIKELISRAKASPTASTSSRDDSLLGLAALASLASLSAAAVKNTPPSSKAYLHDVFVSYKSAERPLVRPYFEALKAASLGVWWDQMIPPGAKWGFEIDKALQASRAVVVFWTPASVKSEEVWTEANHGLENDALFPILLQPCEPGPRFRRRQWLDLTGASAPPSAALKPLTEALLAFCRS